MICLWCTFAHLLWALPWQMNHMYFTWDCVGSCGLIAGFLMEFTDNLFEKSMNFFQNFILVYVSICLKILLQYYPETKGRVKNCLQDKSIIPTIFNEKCPFRWQTKFRYILYKIYEHSSKMKCFKFALLWVS